MPSTGTLAVKHDGRYSRQRPCRIRHLQNNGGTDEGIRRCWDLLVLIPSISLISSSPIPFGSECRIVLPAPPRWPCRGLLRNRRNPQCKPSKFAQRTTMFVRRPPGG